MQILSMAKNLSGWIPKITSSFPVKIMAKYLPVMMGIFGG